MSEPAPETPAPAPAPVPRKRRARDILRSLLTTLAALAALAFTLAWMAGVFRDKAPPTGTVEVLRASADGRPVVVVESRAADETVVIVGSVQPRRKIEIASQIPATIREINVRAGDPVQPDQLLVTLDDRELLAQLREAAANLTAAEADLVVRRGDAARGKSLRANNAISVEDYARLEGAYNTAVALVERARAQVERLDVLLSYTKILSPARGVVAERRAEPGDLAAPGKPILVLHETEELELHGSVPESLALAARIGQKIPVRVDAAGYAAVATIREIVPRAEQATRSVLVKVALPPLDGKAILPGMFGRMEFPVGTRERLVLPRAAVRSVGQLDMVDLVEPDGRIARRFVRLGNPLPNAENDKVEILSGLDPGDRVALPLPSSAAPAASAHEADAHADPHAHAPATSPSETETEAPQQ